MLKTCRTFMAVATLVLLGACATTRQPAEFAAGVKTVAFVQHGKEPAHYLVNGVDGKTFWGGNTVAFTPATQGAADVRLAGQATIVSAIATVIAKESMKSDPELYTRTIGKMVGERSLTSEIAPGVFPALAAAWGTTYDPARLVVVPNDAPLADKDGRFQAQDPGTDLVLAYGINQLVLSEKFSAGTIFKAMGTLGLHDRDVVPVLWAGVTAFKRDDKGVLRQVWWQECQPADHITSEVTEKWSVLEQTPEKGARLLNSAVPIAIGNCKKVLKPIRG